MYVRQIRRKCGVRGCKNTDCFSISRTREAGNSVIICRSCLKEALGAVDDINPETGINIPALNRTDEPPLFFNDAARRTAEESPSVSDDISSEPKESEEARQQGTKNRSTKQQGTKNTKK